MAKSEPSPSIEHIRHSLAHLLAATVRDLYPGAKNAIGPAIENGFYQDFDLPEPISDADLPRIEKRIGPEDRTAKLAFLLRRGGLLKEDWDPEKHPRWPAGSPDGQGGEFAPAGEETSGGSSLVQLDSPECAEEWNYAETRCDELRNSPSFGTTGRLGFGRTFEQCVRGMVSERCGRNPIR